MKFTYRKIILSNKANLYTLCIDNKIIKNWNIYPTKNNSFNLYTGGAYFVHKSNITIQTAKKLLAEAYIKIYLLNQILENNNP